MYYLLYLLFTYKGRTITEKKLFNYNKLLDLRSSLGGSAVSSNKYYSVGKDGETVSVNICVKLDTLLSSVEGIE